MAGFNDPVIGGAEKLIRKAVQSPNYVPGTAGWTINKDGSAEFNNLGIRGTFNGTNFIVNSAGLFIYNGAPAKGTLILAIAESNGTDAFGNNYGQGFNVGVWSAATGNQLQHFGIDNNGKVYVASSTGATVTFIDSTTGAILGYDATGQAAGHLQASMAPAAGIDSAGNVYVQGLAAYTTVSGRATSVQLGLGSFAGTPAAGLFTHDKASPANSDPFAGSLASSAAGTNAVLYSGKSTAGATGSGVECDDSVFSGVAGGQVSIIAGKTAIQGSFTADGGAISSDGAGDLTIGNNFTLTPKIATPPNTAAVKATTATLAQTEACLGALIQSLQNRGMVT